MGLSLSYRPTTRLSEEKATSLTVLAKAMQEAHSWWCEPMNFLVDPDHGLFGLTKLSTFGYETGGGSFIQVAPEEEWLMVWNDCNAIACILASWSKRHATGWELSIEGEPFGAITTTGAFSRKLESGLAEFLEVANAPRDPQERLRKIATIDHKHSSRKQ